MQRGFSILLSTPTSCARERERSSEDEKRGKDQCLTRGMKAEEKITGP